MWGLGLLGRNLVWRSFWHDSAFCCAVSVFEDSRSTSLSAQSRADLTSVDSSTNPTLDQVRTLE